MIKFDIEPFFKPGDPFIESALIDNVKKYYDLKYRIACLIQPETVLEIGVRAGYSAAAFLSSGSVHSYVGLDRDRIEGASEAENLHGGIAGYSFYAEKMLMEKFPAVWVHIMGADTQTKFIKVEGIFDLIHIDGDHSFEGCSRDLNNFHNYARWILIDDYDSIPEVHESVDSWLSEVKYESISIPGFRGEKLVRTGRA